MVFLHHSLLLTFFPLSSCPSVSSSLLSHVIIIPAHSADLNMSQRKRKSKIRASARP